MPTLAEFLKDRLEEQRSRHDAEAESITSWIRSVETLIGYMEATLGAADPERALKLNRKPLRFREEGVGFYVIPSLTIEFVAREVRVVPISRKVVASFDESEVPARRASGRVDLTNGSEKFLLYRFVVDGNDRWMIADDRDYRIRPFGPEAFEAAIQRLLE